MKNMKLVICQTNQILILVNFLTIHYKYLELLFSKTKALSNYE